MEVQLFPPRRTSRSGRFLPKPCFCLRVNLEPSERCSLHWAQGLGPRLLRENSFMCVAWGSLDKLMLPPWGVYTRVCTHIHTTKRTRAMFPCHVLFLGNLYPPLEPTVFSSVSSHSSAWARSHCPQPRGCSLSWPWDYLPTESY